MASFLPLVRELSGEYDAQAIAAAALQMVYDRDCPNWMKGEWEVPEDSFNKPVIKGKKKWWTLLSQAQLAMVNPSLCLELSPKVS